MDPQTQTLSVASSTIHVRRKRCRRRGRKPKSMVTKTGIDNCVVENKSLNIGSSCGPDAEGKSLTLKHQNKPPRKRKRYRKRKAPLPTVKEEKGNNCCQPLITSLVVSSALETCPGLLTSIPDQESKDFQRAILTADTPSVENLSSTSPRPLQSKSRKRKRRKRHGKRKELDSVIGGFPTAIPAYKTISDIPRKIASITDIENGTIVSFKRLILHENGPAVEKVKAKVFMRLKSAEAENLDTLLIRPILNTSGIEDHNQFPALSDEPQLVKFSEIYELISE